MKALVSAYACEPGKGSEPEVGWSWVISLSKKFDQVVVVTRTNNKTNIESAWKKLGIKNVVFKYYDLPYALRFWKRKAFGARIYAFLWEVGIFFFLSKLYEKKSFDIVQRITFVSYHYPSFLWYFGKKFILGPVAGGERYPISFFLIFTIKGFIKELVRFFYQRVSLVNPLVLLTLHKADEIIAVNKDTKSILPAFAQHKTYIKPAISINTNDFNFLKKTNHSCRNYLKILYVGNLIELKGVILILMALNKLPENISYKLTIVGSGHDESRLKRFSISKNLYVNFVGQIHRTNLSDYYNTHDLFIFPSLHDSGGMVVLEAKAHGLKVITSSFGGPKMFVDSNDIVIDSSSPSSFVNQLSGILIDEYNKV